MIIRSSYKTRLFANIFGVFLVTIILVTIFQYKREKDYRKSLVENTLNTINRIVNQYMDSKYILKTGKFYALDSLQEILPQKNIRITLINKDGEVLYDSFVEDYANMENHLHRTEVQESLRKDHGANIRKSATTGQEFYYYARNYGDYFVRTAMLYDVRLTKFLRTDHLFIYFILLMFVLTFFVLIYVTDWLGTTISRLKDFAISAGKNEPINTGMRFPKNELGIIGEQIVQIYENLRKTKDQLVAEREKIYRHLQVIDEGVAVFSAEKTKLLANPHFIQHINVISDKKAIKPEEVFEVEKLSDIVRFINDKLKNPELLSGQKEITIEASGKFFHIQSIFFPDRSFEIMINDITKQEKNRLIKQEMISNLAHELKTPVTSIMGYLETILTQEEMDTETHKHFVGRAYRQAKRLTALIGDISLLNKIGEADDFFKIKEVKVRNVVKDAIENQQLRLAENHIRVRNKVVKGTLIQGNRDLIYSIFQNLLENTILYGGEYVQVEITKYLEDELFCYFSYADTGPGIPEEHQKRIFERFYRIDTGRSRKQGGTGLGLSIVKNAIVFHRGEITVRNRPGGGVEFLFTLAKNRE